MKAKSILIALLAMFVWSNINAQTKKTTSKDVVFNVNMDCNSCKKKIEKNIPFEKGVKSLEVSLEKQSVAITYDSSKTNIESLQSGFKKIGYDAKVISSSPEKLRIEE